MCVNLKHLAEETLFRWLAEVTEGSSSLFPLYDELHGHKGQFAFNTAVESLRQDKTRRDERQKEANERQ